MAQTIFILGTDPQQNKELQELLQERIAHHVVTAHSDDALPPIKESDMVVITSEEKNSGTLYRRLLNKLEEQVHRTELLSDLIRLFSSSLQIDELLERVVSKSTEVLGDTSLVLLAGEESDVKLRAAFSKDRQRLVKILLGAVNLRSQVLNGEVLAEVLERRNAVIVPDLAEANISPELRALAHKYSVTSILAVPIQTKERVLGAFVSLSNGTRVFSNEDLTTASAVADFTAIALENAGLFTELQRTADVGPEGHPPAPRLCPCRPLHDTSLLADDRRRPLQAGE